MKLLLLSNVDALNENNVGILNKMFGQAEAFKKQGIEIHFIYNQLHLLIVNKICSSEKIRLRPSSTKDYYDKILMLIRAEQYDCIYIRYPLSEYFFLNFLENAKAANSKLKIILDFPTYPYGHEITDNNILTKDSFFSKYLKQFVDFGICYNKLNYIHNIPVYCIGNGINVESIKIQNKNTKRRNRIDLIAVANIDFWQGYDRLVEGLKIYYNNNNLKYQIYINIVGLGNDIEKLIGLVGKYNLENRVIFHGYKSGKDLDELFDNCDIGIGTLGMYRKKMTDGATLKVREYCARGIPFVLGYDDLDFSSNFKYALKVKNDDTPININTIIKFCHKVYEDKELVTNMRKYAEENLTWEAKLKPIISKMIK